jgi:hypothetical protein
MRPVTFGMRTVNCNRTLDPAILQSYPKSVPILDIPLAKFGKFPSHLALEREAEPHQSTVVVSVKLNDFSDGSGQVALVDGDSHDDTRKRSRQFLTIKNQKKKHELSSWKRKPPKRTGG